MLSACTSSSGNGSPAASFVKDDQSICRLDRRSRLQHAATMAVNDTPSHQLLFVGSVTAATASKEDGTPVAPRANVCCVRHLIHQVLCSFLLLHSSQLGTCGIPRHSQRFCNSWDVHCLRQIALAYLMGYRMHERALSLLHRNTWPQRCSEWAVTDESLKVMAWSDSCGWFL